MQTTFKQYLTEGKKAVDRDTAEGLFKQIYRATNPDGDQRMSERNGKDSRWFEYDIRAYDFFTDRGGEEDDDHPIFTGDKKLNKILKSILKGIEFEFWSNEKSWITIRIKGKKLTAKQLKADKKKKIESVRSAVREASWDSTDNWERKFWDAFKEDLDKYKKKFITKEEYFDLARNAKWGDDEVAEVAWAKAK